MLILAESVYEAMLEHARETTPEEACGLLAGEKADPTVAETSVRTANAAKNPEVTYAIDPEEQFQAMEQIEAAGRELVGFYHSHPRGPEGPSSTDHARATWPGYHYLIVSLGGEPPMVDAWVWTGETFARDSVVLRE